MHKCAGALEAAGVEFLDEMQVALGRDGGRQRAWRRRAAQGKETVKE